jgi:hemerythrin-like domain-containing protein
MKTPRRKFLTSTLVGGTALGASVLLPGGLELTLLGQQEKAAPTANPAEQKAAGQKPADQKPTAQKNDDTPNEDDVSANEDLMREHGVLNRILLIYDEANRRIQIKEKFDLEIVGKAAGMITRFIEDYHEKLEEKHIFPRFEQARTLTDLTINLRAQHAMGRRVTERIAASTKSKDLVTMSAGLTAFIRMYRPHEAREDTVLFPALHKLVSPHEYDAMGEEFEKIERKTFGGDGFDMAVDQVTELEKQFGIYDISQFTPES